MTRDWHSTQNVDYMLLAKRRLNQPPLIWVQQFAEIINLVVPTLPTRFNTDRRELLINDIGCNVGHFYRCLTQIDYPVSYCGYDVSQTYLRIAKDFFPGVDFFELDISTDTPRLADITVISATLEHIRDHERAIMNIFTTTRFAVLLRTFIGDESVVEYCRTDDALSDYLIKQFTLFDVTLFGLSNGWKFELFLDQATGGVPKLVCNRRSIARSQKIIVFKRGVDVSGK